MGVGIGIAFGGDAVVAVKCVGRYVSAAIRKTGDVVRGVIAETLGVGGASQNR